MYVWYMEVGLFTNKGPSIDIYMHVKNNNLIVIMINNGCMKYKDCPGPYVTRFLSMCKMN